MNCDDIRTQYLAGERSPRIDSHLQGCSHCRRTLPGLEQLRARLDDPGTWEAPPPDLESRIVEAIGGLGTGPNQAVTDRTNRWPWVVAVAAAAAAVVVVIGLTVAGRSDDPDWHLALEPVNLAPGAEAVVEGWNRPEGTEMVFEIDGLPASGADSHYAIWLTSPDGRHISAGTFTSSGTVVGWAGVRRADFPRIWITLEPNDLDESLSGATVFDTAEAERAVDG